MIPYLTQYVYIWVTHYYNTVVDKMVKSPDFQSGVPREHCGFESRLQCHITLIPSSSQVRTQHFQCWNAGSNPVGITILLESINKSAVVC